MKRLLLDTSAYSHLMRGNEQIANILDRADEVFINAVVIGELLAGFKRGGKEKLNCSILHDLLSVDTVSILYLDDTTAERYAIILDYLKKAGTPIPANDIWIAANAMQHGLVLLTTDHHFSCIPQVVSEIVPV